VKERISRPLGLIREVLKWNGQALGLIGETLDCILPGLELYSLTEEEIKLVENRQIIHNFGWTI
jgi:hypothetical protein